VGDTFYVGNTDGVMAFPYVAGADRNHRARAQTDNPPIRRSLDAPASLLSPDRTKLYIGVGSVSNIAETGMAVEQGRAAVHELDLASGNSRIFCRRAAQPRWVLPWEPQTGVLWTVVNERDGIGDETPPDYLTSVRDGGFYGWPYCYWGQTVDDRVPQDPAMVAKAIQPDYALGGHTASLGPVLDAGRHPAPAFPTAWPSASTAPGTARRSAATRSVRPVRQRPPGRAARATSCPALPCPGRALPYGRPVGVTLGPGRSLLVRRRCRHVIWRVTGGR